MTGTIRTGRVGNHQDTDKASPLEAAWHDVLDSLDGSASIQALVNALDGRGALNEVKQAVLAEAAGELQGDAVRVHTHGKLGEAVALIEAGTPKEAVLARVSRRTYFRARRECQECQAMPGRASQ